MFIGFDFLKTVFRFSMRWHKLTAALNRLLANCFFQIAIYCNERKEVITRWANKIFPLENIHLISRSCKHMLRCSTWMYSIWNYSWKYEPVTSAVDATRHFSSFINDEQLRNLLLYEITSDQIKSIYFIIVGCIDWMFRKYVMCMRLSFFARNRYARSQTLINIGYLSIANYLCYLIIIRCHFLPSQTWVSILFLEIFNEYVRIMHLILSIGSR